ncbi:FkbM family methyltransferase [Agrobacterium sp. CCNWLW71]|uniref:FkbM family methyltransferase n=1 Tax=unclassified Agrobacterium TaxID=2632611 RepID=UPI002FF143BF
MRILRRLWAKLPIESSPPRSAISEEEVQTTDDPFEGSGFDEQAGLHFKNVDGVYSNLLPAHKVFVAHERRLNLYKNGLDSRIRQLLWDYRIEETILRPGDVIVDVGANNGEFGIWATERGARYFGFEPDPVAFAALKRNVSTQQVFECALSNTEEIQSFFLATSEADSSLFKPQNATNEIKVKTLKFDTIASTFIKEPFIRLLKVEAEGMEPEVLQGAADNIHRVEYVAVDAGPERGGESTAVSVLNFLHERNFEILDCFLFRGTFLLKNKNLVLQAKGAES